ncbi:S24 family peptidase [Pseudovibrio axinellae]|nr:S24 family peptidase [Pseudovibrio axinellae]
MLISTSKTAGLDLNELVLGESSANCSNAAEGASVISIPRVDIQLAAGCGALSGDSIEKVEDIPFTKDFLGGKLGRSSTDGLIILTADGDSMDPVIADGGLVMVDKKRNTLSDGVYAFVYGGLAPAKYTFAQPFRAILS